MAYFVVPVHVIVLPTMVKCQEFLGCYHYNNMLIISEHRKMFQLCGESEGSIAADLLQCEMEVEAKVLAPLQSIDVSTFRMG